MSKRHLCLVLHLNQNVTSYASIAAAPCYRLLLEVLRRDARRKITIHISGTLLVALNWLEPEIVAGLRELVDAGQIELLGSTFAQNIPRVTPAEDNDLQVVLHRRWMRELFDRRPPGFWNPERCWGEAYVDLIARHGYDFTFLEDQIVESGGLPHEASVGVIATAHGKLRLVRDDRTLRHRVNATVWGNGWDELDRYLSSSPRRSLFFAEDGEAIGLWALEHGHDPRLHWHRMEELLGRLEQRGDLQLSTCSEALADSEPFAIRTPPNGQASWMVEALKEPGARFHEAGYADWFDFARRSERLQTLLELIETTRRTARDLLAKREDLTPIEHQLQVVYCTREYELGCIGMLHIGAGQWSKIRYATLLARIRELLRDAGSAPQWLGLDERPGRAKLDTWITERDLIVLSPRGSIAWWFDRRTGHELCGNEVATSVFDEDNDLPLVEPIQDWINEYREQISPFQGGELDKLLPAEYRDGFQPAERRKTIRDRFEASHPAIHLFQGTATPYVALDGHAIALDYAGTVYAGDHLESRWQGDGCAVHRVLALGADGLRIRDTITARGDAQLQYTVRHALCPGYDRVLLRGRAAITPVDAGVFNASAALGVQLRAYGAAAVRSPGTGLLDTLFDLVWSIDRGHAGTFVADYALCKLDAIADATTTTSAG